MGTIPCPHLHQHVAEGDAAQQRALPPVVEHAQAVGAPLRVSAGAHIWIVRCQDKMYVGLPCTEERRQRRHAKRQVYCKCCQRSTALQAGCRAVGSRALCWVQASAPPAKGSATSTKNQVCRHMVFEPTHLCCVHEQVVERPGTQRHAARKVQVHRREEVCQLLRGFQPRRPPKAHVWELHHNTVLADSA